MCSADSIGPDNGEVRVGDVDVARVSDAELVAFRNRHVGFVFQFHHLLPEFNAIENAEMPLRIARRPLPEARQPRARRCSNGSGSANASITGRGCCRAASSSASRWRGRW